MTNKKVLNNLVIVALILVMITAVIGCTPSGELDTMPVAESPDVSRGEHARDEGGEGEGEESGTEYSLTNTYDNVRNGAHLILVYDEASNAFQGTVKNTTESPLQRVRVEIHLSNGTELGPTQPVDLAPGESIKVTLQATDAPFNGWSAHPEVGGGEGGGEHAGESGEHGNESGEHGGEGNGENGGSEGNGEHGGD